MSLGLLVKGWTVDEKEHESAERFIFNKANKVRVLTFDEEQKYIPLCQAGDQKAWGIMMKFNQRLVMKIAHKFEGNGLDLSDLIQEGNIGLIRSIQKFKVEKGFKLSTYATWWIEQAMKRAICNKSRMVRLPVHMSVHLVKVQRAWSKGLSDDQETLTSKELAERTGIPLDKVERCKQFFRTHASLDAANWEDDEAMTLGNLLRSDDVTEESAEALCDKSYVRDWLMQLDENDRDFLIYRFGFIDMEPKTRAQLAYFYGTTEDDIQQREQRVLKIFKEIADQDLLNMKFLGHSPPKKRVRRGGKSGRDSSKAKAKPKHTDKDTQGS